jgi:uncharacterized protein (DUF1015 family)
MAVIRPFKALRPDPKVAHLVASVPYDVVNRKEAEEYAKGNPLSFLRITRAEIELNSNINPYSKEVYQKAKANLERIKKEAPLIIDEVPHFYIYRLTMDDQIQTGIAATFSIDDYYKNVILKHENTRQDKEVDRTNHITATEAQTGPVFLTYRGVVKINDIIENITNEVEPLNDFTAPDGIKHSIWILPDGYNQVIISEIARIEKLYIADGHHRAASAGRVAVVRKENNPHHSGKEEYNFFLAVLFPAEQLKILPYNRIVKDLNGLTKDEFINKISENFYIEINNLSAPNEVRTFSMFLDSSWYFIKPKEFVKTSSTVSENLDISILQNYLLKPLLGIDDPRTSKRIDFIGGIKGTAELERLVNSEKAAVAFSLFPVTVDDLMNIADAGEIMPPKSTWFEPKLRDGLLVHLI